VGLRNGGDGCKGGVWVSLSLEAKNKREKFASSFTSPDFFFKKFYVMKCLRSKKRLNAPLYTTCVNARDCLILLQPVCIPVWPFLLQQAYDARKLLAPRVFSVSRSSCCKKFKATEQA
jgi:hypothetical protein